MAVLDTSMSLKTRENIDKNAKNKTKKSLLIAQELKLARVLAGNNKTARDRALKGLRKWFQNRAVNMPFTEDDFLRIWKGLFYSMWMSDKPLVQEDCAENIANLVHSLPVEAALLFYKCGTKILMNEWFGIDQLRLDKFLMFVRRLLRQILFALKAEQWGKVYITSFTESLSETILNVDENRPTGLLMHFIEIYLEEVAKVADQTLPGQILTVLLSPFIKQLAFSDDRRIIDHIKKHIFFYLIRQTDLGLEYQNKYTAWKKLGFPGSINSMQKVDGEAEEIEVQDADLGETSKALDPRAGRVDVELPQLKLHPKAISKALARYKFERNTNTKSRKCLNELSEHFKKLASGVYPLGVKKVKLADTGYDTSVRKAVNRLVKFDKKIMGQKKSNKRKLQVSSEDDLQNEDLDTIQLKSGKKIKVNAELRDKFKEEMKLIIKKQRLKQIKNSDIEMVKAPVESTFERNSGTWFVTKTSQIEETDCVEKVLFPKRKWETVHNNQETEAVIEEIKKKAKKRSSLPPKLYADPFSSTPVKKVKINTNLNKSQDVHEHHQQILSSPAIPYDADKKPAKPLLKTPIKKSPINPFYRRKLI